MNTLRRFLRALALVGRGGVMGVAGNLSLVGLSVGLALSLWLFVTDSENPRTEAAFNRAIPIRLLNVPDDLAVAGTSVASVTVRVEGPDNDLDDLTVDDFEATVNLGGFQLGDADAVVEVVSSRRRVEVVAVQPPRVNVRLERVRQKDVPVEVALVGTPQQGFAVASSRSEPESVTISGPESLVALVETAVAEVNVAGARVGIEGQRTSLDLRDERGGDIGGVTVEPTTASVTVDLEQQEFSLSLIVNPSVRGEPAAGYNVTGITADPRLVIVSGPLDVLQSIDAVRGLPTEEISIANSRGDVSRVVKLALPAGARVQGSGDIAVRVSIAPALGQFSYRVTPQARNLDSGLVILQIQPVTVVLAGDVPTLEAIAAGSIETTVDVSGLAAGLHVATVAVEAPSGTTIVRIDPPDVGFALAPR